MPSLPHLFLLLWLLPSRSFALLAPAHFSSPFLLSLSSPSLLPSSPSCGTNLGSDGVRLDPTSVIPDTGGAVPVSPIFYFFDGQRCLRSTPSAIFSFVLHPGLHAPTVSGRLAAVAAALHAAAGDDALVTAQATHLIYDGAASDLVSGPLRCGLRDVLAVVLARTADDVDIEDGDGRAVLRMRKEKMYAAVETADQVCFYEGYTRAPEGEVLLGDGDYVDGQEEGTTVHGSASTGLVVGLGVAGIAALAVVLLATFGALYVRARRKEREEEREEAKDIPREEGSDGVDTEHEL